MQKATRTRDREEAWRPGRVLPGHPHPKEDELLSSWMLRLALANYTSAFRLANGILGEPEGSWVSRDVDRSATPRLVEKLSERTGRPVEDVFRLTLRGRYEGRLYIGHRKTGFLRWILPGGLRGGRRSHHGLLYCPLCLRDDPEPYFRARWRLSLSCVCMRHGVRLLGRCPGCGRPPEPHRANLGVRKRGSGHAQRPLSYCSACDSDLREAEAAPTTRPLLSGFQQALLRHVSRGWVEVPDYGSVPSPLWFDGLYQLARLVGYSGRGEKLRAKLESLTGTGQGSRAEGDALADDPTSGKAKFEALSLPWRRHVMHLLAYLMADWPERFLEVASGRTLTQSVALDGSHRRSIFWYEDFCKRHLWSPPYSPTEEEVLSAQKHLRKQGDYHGPLATSRAVGLKGKSRRVKRILENNGRW